MRVNDKHKYIFSYIKLIFFSQFNLFNYFSFLLLFARVGYVHSDFFDSLALPSLQEAKPKNHNCGNKKSFFQHFIFCLHSMKKKSTDFTFRICINSADFTCLWML